MVEIVPTITAENAHVYREQMERVEPYIQRIHIDLMDGIFTPNKSPQLESIWWPPQMRADIHLMYQNPNEHIDALVKLRPQLVVVPAESKCDFAVLSKEFSGINTKLGVALLPETSVEAILPVLPHVQHVLIFSGNLGHQGGSRADLDLLTKVTEVKAANALIEVGWDGGVNQDNVKQIAAAGVDVINVGSFVHTAPDPGLALESLRTLLP